MGIVEEIRQGLFLLRDEKYRDFHSNLMPTINRDQMIGVRTPELRKLAKKYANHREIDVFLDDLPHKYFDENQLHAFIISLEKDFDQCLMRVEGFLPYVDNWATCDQLSPKVFKKKPERLLPVIEQWMESDKVYTVRFGIGMLMQYFLDERFETIYADKVANISSEEYYINMMIAWYFATALAKQYELVIPYIQEKRLEDWTHNKTIQKAIESYRITAEQKEYLRSLKVATRKNKKS